MAPHVVVPAKAGTHTPYRRRSRKARVARPALHLKSQGLWVPAFAGTTSSNRMLLLRRRRAFDEGLAALHLVMQRSFVDLDHDGVGIDAEVLYQRLRDVAHHAGLLFIGAAGGHADGDLWHFCSPFALAGWCLSRTRSSS